MLYVIISNILKSHVGKKNIVYGDEMCFSKYYIYTQNNSCISAALFKEWYNFLIGDLFYVWIRKIRFFITKNKKKTAKVLKCFMLNTVFIHFNITYTNLVTFSML